MPHRSLPGTEELPCSWCCAPETARTYPSTQAFTANGNRIDYVLPTITWLKQAYPTCYTYPFDDMTSTVV